MGGLGFEGVCWRVRFGRGVCWSVGFGLGLWEGRSKGGSVGGLGLEGVLWEGRG